jgi:proton-translocating NADH-quinone oxidoreductase chain N
VKNVIELLDVAWPIISLVVFALLTIPVFRFIRKSSHQTVLMLSWFSIVFVIAFVGVAILAQKYFSLPSPQPFINLTFATTSFPSLSSSFLVDGISVYMAVIVMVLSAAVFLYTVFYVHPSERPSERYYAVMLMLTAAVTGAVFAGDLLTLFIFWEAAAAGSSFLLLFRKTPTSLNATLKFLVMIIIASAFIVFGLSMVYGLTGTLNFWAVRQALIALPDKHLLIFAFIFIAAGFAIEAAIVPFHMWLPDAYTAAPASSSAFLSALIDQASYYVLIRVLIFILTPSSVLNWTFMLAVLAALTMVVGNLLALIQNDVKRLIANICIADVGYNLVAITSVTALGLQGNLYFFLIGGITTALAFMTVGVINRGGFKTLQDFSGVGRKMPLVSLALLFALFSFVGVPPLGGFLAKFMVFTAAIEANLTWLAVIGVLTSVVQSAYLLRLIGYMYTRKPQDETKIKEPKKLLIPIFFLVAAIIILGLYPTIVFNLLQPAIKQLPFIT